jgi:hypothetical protein
MCFSPCYTPNRPNQRLVVSRSCPFRDSSLAHLILTKPPLTPHALRENNCTKARSQDSSLTPEALTSSILRNPLQLKAGDTKLARRAPEIEHTRHNSCLSRIAIKQISSDSRIPADHSERVHREANAKSIPSQEML